MPIAAGERIEFHPQTRGQAFQAEGVPHLATLTFVPQRILSSTALTDRHVCRNSDAKVGKHVIDQ
jgi:hypothetical protein